MKELAPIAIFVYARPEHTKRLFDALKMNKYAKESNVWIFSDNAKNSNKVEDVRKVREYIYKIKENNYFKQVTIIEAEKNKGLANSIISGVSKLINEYGKIIVLEDDLVPSISFIEYMNNALEFYQDDEKIWSISGYNPPIIIPENYKEDLYLSYRGCSWGWATWKDRWNTVDWEVKDYSKFKYNMKERKQFNKGGNDLSQMLDAQMDSFCDSWAIRWCYSQYKQDKYTIYPIKSFIKNEGLDGTGTHSGITSQYDTKLYENEEIKFSNSLKLDKSILHSFKNIYSSGIKNKIAEILILLRMDKIIYNYRKRRKKK